MPHSIVVSKGSQGHVQECERQRSSHLHYITLGKKLSKLRELLAQGSTGFLPTWQHGVGKEAIHIPVPGAFVQWAHTRVRMLVRVYAEVPYALASVECKRPCVCTCVYASVHLYMR